VVKNKVLKGPKVNNRHSTYSPLAGLFIQYMKKSPDVTKIVLGPIKQIGPGKRSIKIIDYRGSIKVQIRDGNSIQILWVIGTNLKTTKEFLTTSSELKELLRE
jgi:hypothetical protein